MTDGIDVKVKMGQVGVVGHYPEPAVSAEPELHGFDKFLAHLVVGTEIDRTFQSLRAKVELAKKKGLSRLTIMICHVDIESMRRDKFPWSEELIQSQTSLHELYVKKAADLALGTEGSTVIEETHHIDKPKDMVIQGKVIQLVESEGMVIYGKH